MLEWVKNILRRKSTAQCMRLEPLSPVTQEDPRTIESVKNTRKAFQNQQFEMDIRAMKAHDADCNDVWTCTKEVCFKYTPDKIVSTEVADKEVIARVRDIARKNKARLRSMSKTRVRKT